MSFRLTSKIREDLVSLIKKLEVRQKDVAESLGISQSWVSNLVSGAAPVRDINAVKEVVTFLESRLNAKQRLGVIKASEYEMAYILLEAILTEAGIDAVRPQVEASGSISIDARNYVRTSSEAKILDALSRDRGNSTLSLMITGSPDSGKSTAAGFFINEYRQRMGDRIANISMRAITDLYRDKPVEELHLGIFRSMARVIDVAWPLKDKIDSAEQSRVRGEIEDEMDFVFWFDERMKGSNRIDHSALLVEDIDKLPVGLSGAVIKTLSVLTEHRVFNRHKFSIVGVLSPTRKDIVGALGFWGNLLPVGVEWFNQDETLKLMHACFGRDDQRFANIYELTAGQPLLTHGIMDHLTRSKDGRQFTVEDVVDRSLAEYISDRPGEYKVFSRHFKALNGVLENGNLHETYRLICSEPEGIEESRLGRLDWKQEQLLTSNGLASVVRTEGSIFWLPRSPIYRKFGLAERPIQANSEIHGAGPERGR